MKRLGIILLCLAFTVGMTACGSKPMPITKQQAQQEADKTITAANAAAMADKIQKEIESEAP